jgi:hypothetical protein
MPENEQKSVEFVSTFAQATDRAIKALGKGGVPVLGPMAVAHDMNDVLTWLVEVEFGSQTALAKELGISVAYLNDVLHARRPVSAELAEKIGWKRVTVFIKT